MSSDFSRAADRVHYLAPMTKGPWKLCRDIRSQVKKHRPDGIVVWHGMVMLPQILKALDGFGIPVLVHGGNPAMSMPRWVDWRYFLLEKVLGHRSSATYVCCSRHVANSFRHSLYLRRFPAAVVPNGVREFPGTSHVPRKLDPGEAFTMGMVARLDSIKDHETLLRAFSKVAALHAGASLEIVGDGPLRQSLETMVSDLRIAESTRFIGQIADVYPVIREWDLFCYATTPREGLGNALIEAMMAGLPCIATAVEPIKEIAGEPPSVRLVRPSDPELLADAAVSLMQDLDARQLLGQAGRQRALTEFGQETFARRYCDLMFA